MMSHKWLLPRSEGTAFSPVMCARVGTLIGMRVWFCCWCAVHGGACGLVSMSM